MEGALLSLLRTTQANTHTHTRKEKRWEGGDGTNRGKKKKNALCPPQGLKELGSILSEQNADLKEIAV